MLRNFDIFNQQNETRKKCKFSYFLHIFFKNITPFYYKKYTNTGKILYVNNGYHWQVGLWVFFLVSSVFSMFHTMNIHHFYYLEQCYPDSSSSRGVEWWKAVSLGFCLFVLLMPSHSALSINRNLIHLQGEKLQVSSQSVF